MVSPPTSKRACSAQHRDPLSDAGILQHVLSYVSPRSYLYIGTVSSLWKQCYETVTFDAEKRVSESSTWRRRTGIDVPRKTNYSAAFQSVAMLTWAFSSGLQLRADNQALQRAAGCRASLLLLAILHALGLVFDQHTLDAAVKEDREAVVDYLHTEHHCPLAWFIGLAPARTGNVRMLRSLRQKGYEFGHFVMCSDAARGGHFEALRFLRSEGCSWFSSRIAGKAAASGNVEMVSTSYAACVPCSLWLTICCALRCFVTCQVQWVLQQEHVAFDATTMAGAAEGGHISMCDYLLSRQCPMDAGAYSAAAGGHHLHILDWLYEHDCPMDASACTAAVYGGHLDVLCWLYEHGCQGDASTVNAAADHSQLDALRYLVQRGCPLQTKACTAAASEGFLDGLKLLHENGCPWDAQTPKAACQYGDLNTVRYLHEQGCPRATRARMSLGRYSMCCSFRTGAP
jgi:hypothetical protein